MNDRQAIREFLRTRRARIAPESAGFPTGGDRRRVPGLRREEVAERAGVSVDYYTKLERGTLDGASDAVLGSIARVLRLDDAEGEYLFNLFGKAGRQQQSAVPDSVTPVVRHLLDAAASVPAIVVNRRMDIIAGNELGWAFVYPLEPTLIGPANVSRFVFCDGRARSFYGDWAEVADDNAAHLRRESARYPQDASLAALIDELMDGNEEFRRRWREHNVRRNYSGAKSFTHPVAGLLELGYVNVELGDPGLFLTTFVPEPGSRSEHGLRLLASWWATEHTEAADTDLTQQATNPR
ncbi:helix-turn-helix transcriptional regulator [Actinoplanes sp. TRM 88003]|uniref:Helix-turn-helix transcriptional regulator n=1 Tax=Paractinoplanes aksuensis TaxID=2939490 RepID=A0ABT1E4D3_9ACTN|nr:helix-turn-helix transcriptional regulator [Actinoplanes aksuensis]MCO8277996.1 helix-turn-helix transcriptional regulator [Actinoplanes aksuensis]